LAMARRAHRLARDAWMIFGVVSKVLLVTIVMMVFCR